MPDEIPPPVPSAPTTKPPLTAQMVQAAKDTGTPKPGAGGWTPSMLQVVALGCVAAGATAALDLAQAGEMTPKVLLVAAGKAAIAYLIAYFGARSAGPRKVDP